MNVEHDKLVKAYHLGWKHGFNDEDVVMDIVDEMHRKAYHIGREHAIFMKKSGGSVNDIYNAEDEEILQNYILTIIEKQS
jgi:hypothetical protein